MYLVYCDGGSRGNPGNAAIGVVIKKDGEDIFNLGKYIGIETNNVAEYTALLEALKKLDELKAEDIKIHLDSELVVKQINGIYKVKNLELQKLFAQVIEVKKRLNNVKIVHVRREFNKEADALVNVALDEFEKSGTNKFVKLEVKESKKEIQEGKSETGVANAVKAQKLPMTIMLQNKIEVLKEVIKGYGSLVIGYSGGIDSSLLSYVASRLLGDKAIAVTIVGAQSISGEIDFARDFVVSKNIRHDEIPVSIFENEALMKNDEERCYYCKKANFSTLKEYGNVHGYNVVADGGNIDDLSEVRPGLKAIRELDIKSPFIQAGMTKNDILEFAKYLELGLEDKESNTCLITRIPINTEITKKRLERVDNCEFYLRKNGYKDFRVRDSQNYAIIEFKGDIHIPSLLAKQIADFFKAHGYDKIYIDVEGYKIGSMSEKR